MVVLLIVDTRYRTVLVVTLYCVDNFGIGLKTEADFYCRTDTYMYLQEEYSSTPVPIPLYAVYSAVNKYSSTMYCTCCKLNLHICMHMLIHVQARATTQKQNCACPRVLQVLVLQYWYYACSEYSIRT